MSIGCLKFSPKMKPKSSTTAQLYPSEESESSIYWRLAKGNLCNLSLSDIFILRGWCLAHVYRYVTLRSNDDAVSFTNSIQQQHWHAFEFDFLIIACWILNFLERKKTRRKLWCFDWRDFLLLLFIFLLFLLFFSRELVTRHESNDWWEVVYSGRLVGIVDFPALLCDQ